MTSQDFQRLIKINMFKTILFDLDGTICDSGLGITRCVKYALEKMGHTVEDETKLTYFIGPPLRDTFARYHGMTAEEAEQALMYYRERYSTIGIREAEAYDGICELVKKLYDAGKTVALATSKPTVFAKIILEEYNIAQYFSAIVGCELDGTRDDKKEVMEECMRQLGITEADRADTIMIGDRHYDIGGAKHFGLHSVGVTYGFATTDTELVEAGADYIVNNCNELGEILMK